jgi:uncharacterized protein DUF1841
MQESKLEGLTLLSWTLQVWRDYRRGVPLTGQHAAIAHCLQNHPEWWSDWETAEYAADERAITTRLIHIHNDAAIRIQIERESPKEIKTLYETLVQKGFTEFESIHTLAVAFVEESSFAVEHDESFNLQRYVERANSYVKEALSRPNLTRTSKSKRY